MSDIANLTQLLLQFREERNWKQFHNPKDVALSLTLEAAELLELMQWKSGDELAAHLEKNKEAVSDELADILAWVLVFASDQNIDMVAAMKSKIAKNAAKYPIDKSRNVAKKYTEL